ncbi:MAG: tetratricopeptide repeat protein [Candidatus Eremiobacteraeota bacterium]|nr:tetratricopeptide repeat protein [Candidatus Eremiobacteraeota bacterium]
MSKSWKYLFQKTPRFLFLLILISFFMLIPSGSIFGDNKENCYTNDLENYKYLKERIKQHPDNLELYLDLGEMCMVLEKYDEAKKHFDCVIKKSPRKDFLFYGAHRRLGHLFLKTGKIDNAIEESKIIERTYPDFEGRWELNGQLYYILGRYDDAERYFMGEFVNATCTDSFVGLGNIYRVTGKNEKAHTTYRAGTVFDPEGPATRCSLANMLVDQGDYEKAERIFNEVLKKNPEYARAYIYMGEMERKRGNYSNAIEHYDKALKMDSSRLAGEAYAGLGKTYMKMAEKPAKESRLKSNLVIAVIMIILTLAFIALFTILKKCFKKIYGDKLLPSHSGGHLILIALFLLFTFLIWFLFQFEGSPMSGKIYPKKVYYLKARNSLEKAIKLNPSRKDLHTDLSVVLLKLGNIKKARQEEKITSGLPEYNLNRRLRFVSP